MSDGSGGADSQGREADQQSMQRRHIVWHVSPTAWRRAVAWLTTLSSAPYLLGLYGPVEQEVGVYAIMLLTLGLCLAATTLRRIAMGRLARATAMLLLLVIVVAQIGPTYLWFVEDRLTDSPRSTFVAQARYATPHVLSLLAAVLAVLLEGLARDRGNR